MNFRSWKPNLFSLCVQETKHSLAKVSGSSCRMGDTSSYSWFLSIVSTKWSWLWWVLLLILFGQAIFYMSHFFILLKLASLEGSSLQSMRTRTARISLQGSKEYMITDQFSFSLLTCPVLPMWSSVLLVLVKPYNRVLYDIIIICVELWHFLAWFRHISAC